MTWNAALGEKLNSNSVANLNVFDCYCALIRAAKVGLNASDNRAC